MTTIAEIVNEWFQDEPTVERQQNMRRMELIAELERHVAREREVTSLLAERMYHQAHCKEHSEAKEVPTACPSCADRLAYRSWEQVTGRTHRPEAYDGPTLNVLGHARSNPQEH